MSEDKRKKAEADLKLLEEVTAVQLPEPSTALVTLDAAEAPVAAEIRRRMDEIDMGDSGSIIAFGAAAQAELQEISQAMLQDVRNKDVGPAGDSLREIVTTIRGFSISELDVRRKRSWWERLLGRAAPFAKFVARYETVQGQIDRVTDNLLMHEHKLLKDIKSLDRLYEKTLDFYDELALYIAAGEEKLKQLDETEIPAKEKEVRDAPEDAQVIKAQELRDLRAARDDLERRVHDLKLTRQVTMQSLPSIRLVQENDKSLVTKINSTLVNTIPLWETQLAQAVTIQRSSEAAAAVKEASDLTNELLTANAENLQQANRAVRQEMERGVFDIAAVKQANETLIATIEESLAIADEGKRKRAEAEAELQKMEAELRDTLAGLLAGCEGDPFATGPRPLPRPEAVERAAPRSAESLALSRYYEKVQESFLAQGLLRTDGGGPDVPFDARDLVRNFIRIALFEEYTTVGGRIIARPTPSTLHRWTGPVRFRVIFGETVPAGQRQADLAAIRGYVARLSRLTGLPMRLVEQNANFYVFIVNEDERRRLDGPIRRILPQIDQAAIDAVIRMPRATFCLVFALNDEPSGSYSQALAVIRAEHPDLMRLSCIHEELAQGLGLSNDSPQARPSIFNDDEEFGLLTSQDELLLRMLYDPRLEPGMSAAEARPLIETIAAELIGGPS